MKMKQISMIFFAIIALSVVGWGQLAYPQSWDNIHVMMTKQEVLALAGPPEQDTGDIKGCFWSQTRLSGWQELWVYFGPDGRASNLSVKRYVGTREHFYVQVVRLEYVPTK